MRLQMLVELDLFDDAHVTHEEIRFAIINGIEEYVDDVKKASVVSIAEEG